jgi:hypothetical protein
MYGAYNTNRRDMKNIKYQSEKPKEMDLFITYALAIKRPIPFSLCIDGVILQKYDGMYGLNLGFSTYSRPGVACLKVINEDNLLNLHSTLLL